MALHRSPRPLEVLWMQRIIIFIQSVGKAAIAQVEHPSRTRNVVDLASQDIPVPETVAGTAHGESNACFAFIKLLSLVGDCAFEFAIMSEHRTDVDCGPARPIDD